MHGGDVWFIVLVAPVSAASVKRLVWRLIERLIRQ